MLSLYYPLYPITISQGFGRNDGYDYTKICNDRGQCLIGHNGLDYIRGWKGGKYHETDGANVRAAHAGIITYTGLDGAGGLTVVVRTVERFWDINGIPTYWKTVYAHMKSFSCKPMDEVLPGHILGSADSTGKSTGAHVHFGLKPIASGEKEWQWFNTLQANGFFGAIDPLPYMNGQYAYDVATLIDKVISNLKGTT